jgi:pre-mRNA-splicing factor CDC5/CEF1
MVRVFLKGGVWKNSEDEILKAAIQKYGKQQWARVASLLNRKSAKQCKARWHEWLDPSVRKVEWSREEEEKLLHLAKLLPAQWKTIGPLVGRTATQCQEHYEKLLDEAAAGKSGGDEDEQHLRSQPLRVGQIDSHPETKPARPDPIDMDEDEIEMLQEARARLANTQGKKAKRKGREKMLAQAKRLSELQKRRELKQAGLLSSNAKKKSKRSREIDLGVEIPFHKPAPAGFHDVTSEAGRSEALRAKRSKSVDFKKLNEQQYRSRDRDAAQSKKHEEQRLRTLEKSNMQYVVAQVSKANDPLNIRKRGPLELPEPSVTDQELKQLAKMDQGIPEVAGLEGGSGATKALLADYSDRPLPTPMRTPMTAASGINKQESILREASNLRALEQGQTPLLGGDDPMFETAEGDDGDSKPAARTTTPGMVVERAKTPRRDHFGLNQRPQSELRGPADDSVSVGATTFATNASIRELAREERRAAKLARKQLEEALAALPAPQFDYELEAPMDVDDADKRKVETVMEEDAADVDAAERKRLQEEADKLYEARSSVVKRSELPRPVGAIPETKILSQDDAEQAIDAERWMLLRHDAHAFPVDAPPSLLGGKNKKKKNLKQAPLPPETPLDIIPEDALNAAKESIQAEATLLVEAKAQPLLAKVGTMENAMEQLNEEILNASKKSESSQEVFVPGKGWIKKTKNDMLQSYAGEFDAIQEAASAMRKKNEKVESKVAVLIGGYSKRAQTMGSEMFQSYSDLKNLMIEEAVYTDLQEQEEKGSVRRMDRLRGDIQRLQKDEMDLQGVYQHLTAKTN